MTAEAKMVILKWRELSIYGETITVSIDYSGYHGTRLEGVSLGVHS